MDKRIILGVHISKRAEQAAGVQKTFTEYGCNIKTRLGLHKVDNKVCSSAGIVILEFFGDESKADELSKKLTAIDGVEVGKMVFEKND